MQALQRQVRQQEENEDFMEDKGLLLCWEEPEKGKLGRRHYSRLGVLEGGGVRGGIFRKV